MKAKELDISIIKENIIMTLINTKQNSKMLQDIPSRAFHDLSIIYRYVYKKDNNGIESVIVNNKLAKEIGLNEEMLYSLAVKNTERLFPVVIQDMEELIKGMALKDGVQQDVIDMIVEEVPKESKMYIISNDAGIYGASAMLYEDKLNTLADKINANLYIMPSSVHETIAVSANMCTPDVLAETVNEINAKEVPIEDRLSNKVYLYDRNNREISIATNTINKNLYKYENKEHTR